MTNFSLKLEKAIQSTGFLLGLEPSASMNTMRLLKMLYCADRLSLDRYCYPIIGGSLYATERGPILGGVFDLILQEHWDLKAWNTAFTRQHYNLHMEKDPGNSHLSQADTEILSKMARIYQDIDDWDLTYATCKFPEWEKNATGNSSSLIPIEDVFKALNKEDLLPAIMSQASLSETIYRFFADDTKRLKETA